MTQDVRRTLILTLPPYVPGGIAVKAHLLADHLRNLGHAVTVAHYATVSREPDLAVSLPGLLAGRRPDLRHGTCFGDHTAVSVGCALPELEVTYTRDSPRWRTLIGQHDRHVAVGGTVLAAMPLAAAGVPHLIWCASDVLGDRIDRRNQMSPPRALYDRAIVTSLLRQAERHVLAGPGRILGVSPYTIDRLRRLCPDPDRPISLLHIPVDTAVFAPAAERVCPGRIGFVARLSDPRKNIGFLLEAFARLRTTAVTAELVLVGDGAQAVAPLMEASELSRHVTLAGPLPRTELAALYRTFDVLAIPSLQEGLSIVGLEAMACGVPVVSTRCGGPEAYVRNDETGYLVDFDAAEMAGALTRIVHDRDLRNRLSGNARRMIEREFSGTRFSAGLAEAWRTVWNEPV